MNKIRIMLFLFGSFCIAPELEDLQALLSKAQELEKMRNEILRTADTVVADVNKAFNPTEVKQTEEAQEMINKINDILRKSSASVPDAKLPNPGDRGAFQAIIKVLREDSSYTMQVGRSEGIENRISSALRAFEDIRLSSTDPIAKEAYSYLDSFIGLMEKQLIEENITFDASRYNPKRAAMKRFFENRNTAALRAQTITISFKDPSGIPQVEVLCGLSEVMRFCSDLLDGTKTLSPDFETTAMTRFEASCRVRIDGGKLLDLSQFLYHIAYERIRRRSPAYRFNYDLAGNCINAYTRPSP